MTTIAFIGLGNMGNPMAANLVKAGHTVLGFDLMPEHLETARNNGVTVMANAAAAAKDADVVITMLPAGKHVLSVYEDIAPAEAGRAAHRFLDHRRRFRAQGACHGRSARPAVGRRAGLGWNRRRQGLAH
jgi:3-hydroxyisobutyrate dehydrogenase-like beta-hydroxyacid dehydrogenase